MTVSSPPSEETDLSRRTDRIETDDDIKAWIIEHDARIDVYWENQHKFNDYQRKWNDKMLTRVVGVEKKLIWACGFASAIGTLAGFLGGNVIKAMTGG